jgi:hypothetical protein
MKKVIIFATILMLISISTITAQSYEQETIEPPEITGIFDRTLVMGMIVNTIEDGETITANAVYLFYYSPGILINKAGIISGLKEVSMMKSPFLFLYEPGPFKVVTYVLGFARDFNVVE